MIFFYPLFSGSSGNATFIGCGSDSSLTSGFLLDCGKSAKAIADALMEVGRSIYDIQAIVLTHDHMDHVSALKNLNKKIHVPVYATHECLSSLCKNGYLDSTDEFYDISSSFVFNDFSFSVFNTSHDANGSCGYVISCEDKKIGYATDLGFISEDIQNILEGSKLVFIESNYDKNLLSVSRYPYPLKQRIKSDLGHLSNDDCANALVRFVSTGTYYLLLAHLSQENNLPSIAQDTALTALHEAHFLENIDFSLIVCNRNCPTKPIVL